MAKEAQKNLTSIFFYWSKHLDFDISLGPETAVGLV